MRPSGRESKTILFSVASCFFAIAIDSHSAAAQSPAMVEFLSSGKIQRGLALVEFARETIVLGRDGQLHSVEPGGNELRPVRGRYEPLSAAELRNELRAEFGREYEVISTTNFLVVQPRGRGDRWPKLFEQSHRSFVTYMKKHGVHVREGRFPMVAVVFPDERAMYREFERREIDVSRVAGLYSNNTNRVMTHDGGHLSIIAATVRHEAAHQSAFNSGIHNRLNDTPRWITEGIGQMFEPSAMTGAQAGSSVRDRLNRDSMHVIANKYPDPNDVNFDRGIVQLIGDDKMFDSDRTVDASYALAWAMMFYLAERDSKAFAQLLNFTATRPPFQAYEKEDRLRDFQRIVGVEPYEFSRRVRRYLQSL